MMTLRRASIALLAAAVPAIPALAAPGLAASGGFPPGVSGQEAPASAPEPAGSPVEPGEPEEPGPRSDPEPPDERKPEPAKAEKLSKKELKAAQEALPEKYRVWLEDVEPLISDQERQAFLALEQDYQREAFIDRFWRVRDPYPDTARNELRDRWESRLQEIKARYGSTRDDRARMLLLNGPPAGSLETRCSILHPLDIWFYSGSERVREEFFLIFAQRFGSGPYRLWRPEDGLTDLLSMLSPTSTQFEILRAIDDSCIHSDTIIAAIQNILARGQFDYALLLNKIEAQPDTPGGGEWVATFHAYSTELPAEAATFAAELSLDYPGRHQQRTVVQGVVSVPVAEAAVSELGGHRSYNFLLTGEVLRESRLFDNFRYQFNLPAAELTADRIPLVFERYLRPGDYRLVLKVEDLNSRQFFRTARDLAVPTVEGGPTSVPEDPETARILAEANAAISRGETTLKIVPPRGELQTGLVRFDTLTTGDGIAKVMFALDGQPVLTKTRPPYSVELDLGSLPRLRTLTVTAYDAADDEVAADQLQINAASHRFAVRLIEPRRGRRYEQSLRAEARVELPEGKVVERLEFYLNDDLLATLYQPPFVQPILLPPDQEITYVRAVAYQPDGNSTEDLVFVNAPAHLEEVEVQLVELFISALDESGRPVEGLTAADFRVFEDGAEQEPMRFDRVSNLPIHAAILVDVSASMEENLGTAKRAALGFFEGAITPRDRAMLLTFNDHPHLGVKFTSDVTALAGGLAGLHAERGTALYDSLIFALYYFNGIKGQRAVILLSDGKDEHSRFSFGDSLDYARRAGVAIYAIGLLPKSEKAARKGLSQIADATGGRSFFISSIEELPPIYEAIQRELRSRYYLAYQSTNSAPEERFRTIEVRVARPGVEAKTLRGYYP